MLMIAYAMVLLTDLEDIREVRHIVVQYGTAKLSLDGEAVRQFVKCTNHAYHDYPYQDCLAYGLALLAPEFRPVFKHLYETLREVFVWNE